MKNKSHSKSVIRLFVWIIVLSVRFLFPLADPPSDLSWSGGYYADEGFWVHNARNEVLFENGALDEWNNKLVSPTLHYPVRLLFGLLGVRLLTVRIWAFVLSVLTLILLDKISRRLDPSGMLFFLLGINSFLVAYQRIAILESSVLPIAALTMWLWILGQESGDGWHKYVLNLLTGIAAAWTWQIKTTQLYFIPVVLFATWLSETGRKKALLTIARQGIGVILVALLWLISIYIPDQALLNQYNRFYLSQHGSSYQDIFRNLLQQPAGIYFNRLPVIISAALLMTGLMIIRRRFRFLPPALVFAWTWFVAGMIALMPLGYRPVRYYVPLLIPVTILGFRFISSRDTIISLKKLTMTSKIFLLLFLLLPVSLNIPLLADVLIFKGVLTGLTDVPGFSITGAIAIVIWSLVWAVILFKPEKMSERFISITLMICVLFQGSIVVSRMINRSYDVLETSKDLAKLLPDNAVIAGQWAPQLVLETPFRAVPVWENFVNWQNPFTKYGITHIISWEYPLGNELDYHYAWFPETMMQTELLKTYTIKNSSVSLRRIKPDLSDEISN